MPREEVWIIYTGGISSCKVGGTVRTPFGALSREMAILMLPAKPTSLKLCQKTLCRTQLVGVRALARGICVWSIGPTSLTDH